MRVSIVRSIGHIVDLKSYNAQELGLGKALCDRGFDVQVFFASADHDLKKNTLERSGRSLEMIFVPFTALPGKNAIFHGVFKELNRFAPDIIQVHECTQVMSLAVSIYAKYKKIPVILYQGQYQYSANIVSAAIQKLYDGSFGVLQRLIVSRPVAKTPESKKFLTEIGYKNIAIIPVGLDVERIDKDARMEWRIEDEIASESKILLYIGILEKRRNIEFLIRLVRELPEHFILLIAGEGPERECCQSLVMRLSLEHRVFFLGQVEQSDISSLYNRCDAYLMASDYEIYGMTILEAMYFGAVVFSTKTAGACSLIQSKKTGILLDGLDVIEWREAILKVVGNPEQMRFIKDRAQQSVQDSYTWEAISVEIERLYLQVLMESAH